jgi:hypothetical protein
MAKLPNAHLAYVEPEKLSGYLLNSRHIRGAAKARFFATFGFSSASPEVLAAALVAQGQGEVSATEVTPFGVLYVTEGSIETPSGRLANLRVVWEIKRGESAPRLVTAYPMDKDNE